MARSFGARGQETGPMGTNRLGVAAVKMEVSPGEMVDRLTILELKIERIADPEKRRHVVREYEIMSRTFAAETDRSEELETLRAELKKVNTALWQIEDEIRDHERRHDFGPEFVALARSVYRNNDRRAAIKRQINEHLGSVLIEEKSYSPY
jgi:hypothetical protein